MWDLPHTSSLAIPETISCAETRHHPAVVEAPLDRRDGPTWRHSRGCGTNAIDPPAASESAWVRPVATRARQKGETETSSTMVRITYEALLLVLITLIAAAYYPNGTDAYIFSSWHALMNTDSPWTAPCPSLAVEGRVEEIDTEEEFGWRPIQFLTDLSVKSSEFGKNQLIYKVWTPLNPSNICNAL
jgi:hypothetical protein